jgi:hypothetical protein
MKYLSTYEEFIAAQQARPADVHLHEKQATYLASLDKLYQAIEKEVSGYKGIQITRNEAVTLQEASLSYQAPILDLTIGGSLYRLIPVGFQVIGGTGRVDLMGPQGGILPLLLDTNGQWVWLAGDTAFYLQPRTADNFLQALQWVAEKIYE